MRHQMEALNQAIADSAQERQAALAESIAQTAEMLRTFSRERVQAIQELRATLAADREERSAAVCGLLADANAERLAYARDLRHATQVQARELIKDRRERSQEVAGLIDGFRESRIEMAEELSASLFELGESRRQDVADLLDGFRESRNEMAHDLAERLAESVRETHVFVSGLSVWRGAAIRHSPPSAAAQRAVPNYLLRDHEELKPVPRIVSAFELPATVALPRAEPQDLISLAVQRAQEPQGAAAQPAVVPKKAEPSISGRPAGKVAGKAKKRS